MKLFARGAFLIHCILRQHRQYKHMHFCKGNATDCLTNNTDNRILQFKGNLWDDLTFAVFNFTSDDNGTYYCAADGELHTEYQLRIGEGKDVTLRFGPPVK